MTNEKLRALLEEALEYIDPLACEIDQSDLIERIENALAEPAPSETAVVEPEGADGFWKDETYRALVDKHHILVQSEGVDRWHWSASHESNGMTYARGRAASLAEAKKAALEAVKARK